ELARDVREQRLDVVDVGDHAACAEGQKPDDAAGHRCVDCSKLCYVGLAVAVVEGSRFVELYPSYAETSALDDLRAKEYPALATHTYLDFTAANLYATSQISRHLEL